MKSISSVVRLDKEFLAFYDAISRELSSSAPKKIVLNGLFGGACAAFLCETVKSLIELKSSNVLILTSNEEESKSCKDALSSFGVEVLEFKDRDLVFHNVSASHDIERERLLVLHSLLYGEGRVVISTVKSALMYTMPKDVLLSSSTKITVGEERSLEELCALLLAIGYTKVELCEAAGQFARRGDILDLWTGADAYPVRIEFFGDEIDRLTSFDPITQRSLEPLGSLTVLPALELIFDDPAKKRCINEIDRQLKSLENDSAKDTLLYEKKLFESGIVPAARDKYLSLCYKTGESLLSYISAFSRASVIISDHNAVRDAQKHHTDRDLNEKNALISSGLISKEAAKYYFSEKEYEQILSPCLKIAMHPFLMGIKDTELSGLFGFSTRKTVRYGENPKMLFEDIESYRKMGYKILILCESSQGIKSLTDTLYENGIIVNNIIDKPDFDFKSTKAGEVYIDKSSADGFELLSPKIAVFSMLRDEGRRIMENRRRQRILKKSGGAGERLLSYADLNVGDYVVHANYGIGIFEGMESVRIDGVKRDYITIRYAGTDKLFVPCERLEFIGKYIGARDKDGTVKLSRMGTQEWTRTKNRTKNAVRDIAKDLIKLYAERQRSEGYAFPKDSEMEEEFASAFEYELTDSQSAAIDEIKCDMQAPRPMNRLLCGDVGFGKTEVALRAAFKAIMGAKQVAILVPTTILAMQHYKTALQRMRDYPVNIEMLSRFKTATEQAKIMDNLARGGVDLLIGTHKLLSKNVKFKNLGLLIIDEEQRFGVSQKEKLKQLSKNVDVLTLSATPIPRTLNMAMNGIADMSILDEAPGERKPVQTYVLEHNDYVIEEAIRRELSRQGQVLYLYNNVETIGFIADRITRTLPQARVAIAHGQMEKDELEDTWTMLVSGEIDVLVCTTIIETGVDLPNANTLIIENADRMGLSQLHQLRGRVGRSSRQAYAYFTYRQGKVLSEIATKRLSAIRDYAEFGAGFKVALRDLEIRGAGNLLGSEQHGYIDGVGYELYVRLLSEAVLEQEGRTPEPQFEATVDIKIDASIPEYYINGSAHRMEMYKKISLIDSRADFLEVLDEMTDRYGNVPWETMNLLDVALCRALLKHAKVTRVYVSAQNLVFFGENVPNLAIWSEVLQKHPNLIFKNVKRTEIVQKLKNGEKPLKTAILILEEYLRISSEEDNENAKKQ
jgi:transcription-repair coupling factor (superfamily II helicase)